jgi:hypothetical protein
MNTRRAAIDAPRLAARPRARITRPVRPFPIDWTAFAAMMAGIALQVGGVIWFGATINARVDQDEHQLAELATVPATLATLDERSKAQGDQLTHLVAQQDSATAEQLRRR